MANLKLSGDTSGVITVAAPAEAGTNTLTLPATTGTILDTNSALASSKLTGALPAISGAALTGITSGGLTQLASFATTSGTTVAITGLDLSTYKFLYITQDGVGWTSDTLGVQIVTPNGGSSVRWSAGTGPTNSFHVLTYIDLSTGVGNGMYLAEPAASIINGTGGTISFKNTGISTSTTSLTFGTQGAVAFVRGSMKLYGLK